MFGTLAAWHATTGALFTALTRLRCRETYDRQLDFDIGALTVVQPNAIEDPGVLSGNADAVKDVATKITQSLFNKLFALPATAIPGGLAVHLPHPTEPLPRAKPAPKPKPLTKWQQFAKEKGIVKKKNSKLEFDEVSQEWKRRHGYKKANDPLAVPIIDAEEGDQVRTEPPAHSAAVPIQHHYAHCLRACVLHAAHVFAQTQVGVDHGFNLGTSNVQG